VPFRPAEMSNVLGAMAKEFGVDCYFSSVVSGVSIRGKRISSGKV